MLNVDNSHLGFNPFPAIRPLNDPTIPLNNSVVGREQVLKKARERRQVITVISCCLFPLTCPLWCCTNVTCYTFECLLSCCPNYRNEDPEPEKTYCSPPYRDKCHMYACSVFFPGHVCKADEDYLLGSERYYLFATGRKGLMGPKQQTMREETPEQKAEQRKQSEALWEQNMYHWGKDAERREREKRENPNKEQLERIERLLEEHNDLLNLGSGWPDVSEL